MTNILESVKSRIVMLVLALAFVFSAFAMAAAPAEAGYEYACNPWGGYTYHTHWNGVYHYTYYYSYYNEFWGWSPYWEAQTGDGWYYDGWDYCY